jgi:flagellar biosynthesis protein FlhA
MPGYASRSKPASSAADGWLTSRYGLRQLAGDQVAQTAPILLCSNPASFHIRPLLEPFLLKAVVLSPLEISPMVSVQSLGTVR